MLTEIRIEEGEREDAGEELACLKREFPTVAFTVRAPVGAHRDSLADTTADAPPPSSQRPAALRAYVRPGTEIVISSRAWKKDPWDPLAFDAAIVSAIERSAAAIRIQGDALANGAAMEVLTRYQRFIARRNEASVDRRFYFVLRRLGELYDRKLPLARAAYDHALDAWAWLLRLAPDAGLDVQLATLFHDIDGLINGIDGTPARAGYPGPIARERRDQRSDGPQIADDIMASCGIDERVRARGSDMIKQYAQGERSTADLAVLADASALAFFSLTTPVYFGHFGEESTRQKAEAVLQRLRSRQRPRLSTLRLLPEVERMVRSLLEEAPPRTSRTSLDAISVVR